MKRYKKQTMERVTKLIFALSDHKPPDVNTRLADGKAPVKYRKGKRRNSRK